MQNRIVSPIHRMCKKHELDIYVKREDLIPVSFGGNKARKAIKFFEAIDAGDYDTVVTYGSSSSNHCRVVANMAVARGMKCDIIGPEEASEETFNSKLMNLFDAEITIVPVSEVHDTIEEKLEALRMQGKKPYFIPGGGHGNIGTEAFVECYEEIREYEKENNIKFDYIFFASGTGTTHAGLVCGQLIHKDERKIVGISIARKNPRGRDVVLESIHDYLEEHCVYVEDTEIEDATIFCDQYINDGYGKVNEKIDETIIRVMRDYGIPLDSTYTGKAFWGMQEYLKENGITDKNILFIHTGGTPLFFDALRRDL